LDVDIIVAACLLSGGVEAKATRRHCQFTARERFDSKTVSQS
jgi:hypothetical protein